MKGKKMSFSLVWKIAFTYIGAVIGAGFASGQEIYQFFIQYGKEGLAGIFLAWGLFIVGGVLFLRLAQKMRVDYYYEIFYKVLGRHLGLFVDLIFTLFILGGISVMLAGSGSICQEIMGVHYSIGVLVTLVVVMVTVAGGVKGILLLNTFLIPFLIITMLYTSLINLAGLKEVLEVASQREMVPWFVSGSVYVAFNLFLSMGILTSIGSEVKNTRTLNWGGILGGALLGLVLFAMGSAMFAFGGEIGYAEMPMLLLADLSGPGLRIIYMIALLIAMLTTAVANVYSFLHRVRTLFKMSTYNSVMLTIVVVLPLTRFGFANLVKYMYPVFGVVSFLVIILLGARWFKSRD